MLPDDGTDGVLVFSNSAKKYLSVATATAPRISLPMSVDAMTPPILASSFDTATMTATRIS